MDCFLGVVLVVRRQSGHAVVVTRYPPENFKPDGSVFGVGAVELGKLTLPAQFLMNRKLDFEIEACESVFEDRIGNISVKSVEDNLRFVSFPCECSSSWIGENESCSSLVTAFNIVFVFNSLSITEEQVELFWQALATLSQAIKAEEARCGYLSYQVSRLLLPSVRIDQVNLHRVIASTYEGLRSSSGGVSLYVNDSVLVHLGVIPLAEAPEPPSGHEAVLLTDSSENLQSSLPVDSASNVRRIIDAAKPSQTIKGHMIDLGLPISTIQRIVQHLVYWKKARIVPPLTKRLVLALCPSPTVRLPEHLREKFKIHAASWLKILHAFSLGAKLADVKESLTEEIPQLQTKFTDIVESLLSEGILSYSAQYFRYFPPRGKRLPLAASMRPKFQNTLPPEIRSAFSPAEFEVIYERLKLNPSGSELMVKLISNYVKKHKDVMTARVELNEQMRCTNDDFHRFTDALSTGFLDSLLVKYECDLNV